ncbi:MAG: OmpA family protein [Bacteroidia bacterium]|nr:OmpA family protein [Bacteroidia bacterium]
MHRPLSTLTCLKYSPNIYIYLFLVMFLVFAPLAKAQDTLNVFFETNSARIDEKEMDRLDNWLIETIIQNQDSFAIYGYTDDRGSAEYNKKLAYDRAFAVRTFLINNGIPSRSITRIEGAGENVPLASNETEIGRSINRRVSILHFSYDLKLAIREQKSRGLDNKEALKEAQALQKKDEPVEDEGNSLEVIDLNLEKNVVDCQQEARILKAEHGVEVILEPCCLDAVGPDIEVKITPVFTRQEMVIQDVPTMDVDGDCLETDGIVIVQLLNSYGKAVSLPDSCLKLRMPATQQDERKRIYFAVYGNDSSGFAWQSTYNTPEFNVDNEQGYYEVKLDVSRAVAIQKMVPNSRKYRHGPKIWVDIKPFTQKNARVYLSSDDVVLSGVWREKSACYFRKGCMSDVDAFVTVIAEEDDGSYMVAHKALKTIRYKGSSDKGRYLVRKEDFVKVSGEDAIADIVRF